MAVLMDRLTKEDRFVQWSKSAKEIYWQYRAFSPTPGIVTGFREKRLTIKEMMDKTGLCTLNIELEIPASG